MWSLVFFAYSNSFDSALVFDNASIIGRDPRIMAGLEGLKLIFTKEYWYPATGFGLYRPLSTLSYLANYSVFGNRLNPVGYHAVNLALHDLNIALVYALGLVDRKNKFLCRGARAHGNGPAGIWAWVPGEAGAQGNPAGADVKKEADLALWNHSG